ncbi:potassium-transporting ATPase subunit C [Gordonia soli]|uniref:Potassium-transporting ATPase KdpC subunit n=1 Tax=Gordonia soli NBRC 108243 TaxID=1223545 RepID=M0QF94_9ACTN|nr:potassium-transporting ATPase subunit C [Gordonia soli]GAC67275.1 potassium-transporting ATPase C chain [Gordonia soli NBRC 108243]
MKTILAGLGRQCAVAIAVVAAATVVLGIAYPAAVWVVSRVTSDSAEGSQVRDARGCDVGSSSIGIDPQVPNGRPDPYLHARTVGAEGEPFAPGDPAASAASNQGPNSEALRDRVLAKRALIAAREGVAPTAVPADAVTGSGSGLDPHISVDYARLQIPRLARENSRTQAQVASLIDEHTQGREWGFLGEPRVNVLEVNLALGHTAADCGGR